MGRKPKYSKEIKVKACMDYENGDGSFSDIANGISTTPEVVRRWYLTYKEHGPSAFESSNKNSSYSKEFKLSIVEEYTSGKHSLTDLSAKHSITYGVVRNWINKW